MFPASIDPFSEAGKTVQSAFCSRNIPTTDRGKKQQKKKIQSNSVNQDSILVRKSRLVGNFFREHNF